MLPTLRVLLLDENPDDRALLRRELSREFPGIDTSEVCDADVFDKAVRAGAFDLVVTEYWLPWTDGLEVLGAVKARWPECPLIMCTGTGNEEVAVRAMKAGFDDYVLKSPDHFARLRAAVRSALERRERHAATGEARDATKRTLSLLQATLDATADGILVVDREGRIAAYNRRFAEMWRIPQETLATGDDQAALAFVLDQLKDPEAFIAKVGDLYAQLEAESFDVLEFKDGRVFERYSAPQWLEDEPVGRVWSFRDVSQRAKVETELRRAEEKYRTLVERIPAIVYFAEFGTPAPWIYISPRVESILGFPPEDWIADPALWMRQVHPDDLPRVMEEEDLARDTGVPFVSEYRLLARDGRVVWVRDEAEVVEDEAGNPSHLRGVMYDITERKVAEEALRESQERLRSVITGAPIVLFALDADGVFTLSEGKGLEALGLHPGEVVGRSVFDVYRDFPAILELVRRALGGEAFVGTVEVGELVFEVHYEPLLDAGERVLGVVGVATDETELKKAERELRLSLDLLRRTDEERQALLSRLVRVQEEERARIAADIHDDSIQVMTAVGLRLETVRRRLSSPDEAESMEKLGQTVDAAITRLRHLLFELRPRALDTEGLAAALHLYLDEMSQQTDIASSLDNRLAEEPDGDTRIMLYRIAQEALANIRKHADAHSVEVLLEQRDNGFFVRIEDDGSGFEPAEADRLPAGHLGLTSMRERAEMAGGWWRVESAPGLGTIVEFWIP